LNKFCVNHTDKTELYNFDSSNFAASFVKFHNRLSKPPLGKIKGLSIGIRV
jgi:hypothetical protein